MSGIWGYNAQRVQGTTTQSPSKLPFPHASPGGTAHVDRRVARGRAALLSRLVGCGVVGLGIVGGRLARALYALVISKLI